MYYVANLKNGLIIEKYDSLLEAKELVFKYPQYTILVCL
jgi:hypothetical protein